MNDLTQGSIPRHIINMAVPITVGMLVQTLYFLVDLYFVGALGEIALAGVSAAGNISFLIMALTQILGVGAVALIAQAVGRKQLQEANLIFNQSLLIAVVMVFLTLLAGYSFAEFYMESISANAETVAVGKTYLFWFIPNLALQFVLVVMGSALRGTGVVKPTMVVQVISVLINIILAPILIAGWVTGYPMGVAGAGLASSIAIIVAVIVMWRYFHRLEKIVYFDRQLFYWHFPAWKKILTLGFPAGGEFILMFFYMGIIYWAIKGFGSVAQAGFGLGSRVMQAIFMPALALAFALPAVVGQNFGAQLAVRVKKSLSSTLIMISIIMLLLMMVCLFSPQLLLQPFTKENDVIMIGAVFLQLIALNFIPSGIIFTCSGMFQGLGNTWPSLFSMATRLIFFVIPVVWLSQKSYFKIEHVWYLSVFTVSFQAIISLCLLRLEMRKKLNVIYS
ncbi:MATE family efflux transporter [Aliikangiella sp. IMCC44359]|uniref:MATE family efflux transporter n=1 Tax=Aliikangiella sp. IMCC44359 TaxID=3459125 RepID=UPI00403AE0FA